MTSTLPVGIVGVGNMGGGMARRLLAQGWAVRVHDIDRAKVDALAVEGATPCRSAADAAAGVQALIVCVVDASQVEDVLFGASGATETLKPGHGVLLCPTIGPGDVERFASHLQERGIHVIDAPMSGGPARARDGTMSLMVACDQAVFERYWPLIDTLSEHVFRVGAQPGDGARTKLVNNLLATINLAGAAEALALAERLGLDLQRTLEVIERSSGQSWIGSDRLRRAIAGDVETRAHMTLLAKDSRLALEAGREAGFEGPLGAKAAAVFDAAVQAGLGDMDDAALFRFIADRAR
ncbi:MAG: NAD(P)-dependent oxidoreductase [Burkholderiales bacterium]|nr:NAD(P)-dependent oxidoreductase [Burkholderiales bacterium]